MAPPTVVKTGKLMVVKAVLLAILFAPAIVFRAGKVRFLISELPTKVRLPNWLASSPTVVRFGAEREVKVFSSKVRVPLTVASDGMLTDEALRKVALLAQIKFGRSTVRSSPLEAMLRRVPMEPTWVLIWVRRRLLLISMVLTVSRLMPSRLVKPVSWMMTLEAWDMN